ncbi:hypothetical protein ACP4OV_003823 [Aristida adscensionis]
MDRSRRLASTMAAPNHLPPARARAPAPLHLVPNPSENVQEEHRQRRRPPAPPAAGAAGAARPRPPAPPGPGRRRAAAPEAPGAGAAPAVVVSSAAAAREALRTHDADCCSRPDTPGPRRLSYGHKDVAFSPYSAHWRERRRLLVVEFLTARRVQSTWCWKYWREGWKSGGETHQQINERWRKRRVSGGSGLWVYMDGVVGTAAFGNVYGAEQFTQRKRFHQVIDDAMRARSSFTAEDYFPNAVGRLVDRLAGVVSSRERVFREFDAFFEMIIEKNHLERSRAMPGNGGNLADVLIGLMEEHEAGSSTFSRDHVKALLTIRSSAPLTRVR